MRTTTANYDTENAKQSKAPVVIVEFAGVTTKLCSGTFANITANHKKLIVDWKYKAIGIDPLKGMPDTSEHVITVLDKALAMTSIFADNDILGSDITVKVGCQTLNDTDFVSLPTATIVNAQLERDGLTWELRAVDKLFGIPQPIFDNLAFDRLQGALTTSSTSISLYDADNFLDPTTLPANVKAGVLIDNEIIRYDAINTVTDVLSTLTRGYANTATGAHNDGAHVQQAVIFECSPLEFLLYILCTTKGGANGPYDLGISGFGLEIAQASVNIEGIERLGWKHYQKTYEYDPFWVVYDPQVSPDFLRETILEPAAAILYVNSSTGKLDCAVLDWMDYKENFSGNALADADIAGADIDIRYDQVLNDIRLYTNMNHASRSFAKVTTTFGSSPVDFIEVECDDSVTEHGRTARIPSIRHPGLKVNLSTAHVVAARWLNHYADPPIDLQLETTWKQWLLEPMDEVTLTYGELPDITAKMMGLSSKQCRLLEQEVGLQDGPSNRIRLKSWDIITDVQDLLNSIYTVQKVSELDITDKPLSLSSDATTTVEAADAYYDNTITEYIAHFWRLFVRVTPPGTTTGSETVTLRLWALGAAAGTANHSDDRMIRYDPGSSAPVTVELDLYKIYQGFNYDTVDKIKIDWYDASAAAGDRPTLEFVGLWFIHFRRTFSEVT